MRPRVYVTQPIAESALLRLKEIAEVDVNEDSSRIPVKDKLIDAAKRSDIILCLLHDTIDRDVLAANPHLKAVASMTITPDRIDVTEATTRKIIVTNIPAVVTDATADIAFGLLLAVARRIVEGDRVVRSGVFPGSQSNHLAGAAVSGQTLGIVGMGRIGQAMARRARGFDMTVLYSDPRGLSAEEEQRLGVRLVSFDELLGQSDFISLHPALNDETRHLIGARHEAHGFPDQYLARADHRREGSGAGADRGTPRGRRDRCLRARAEDRARAADHEQCRADAASRQRRDGTARAHGACGGRQYRSDHRGPHAAELHQSGGIRAGGVMPQTPFVPA
jgi:glyoxylate reductase